MRASFVNMVAASRRARSASAVPRQRRARWFEWLLAAWLVLSLALLWQFDPASPGGILAQRNLPL